MQPSMQPATQLCEVIELSASQSNPCSNQVLTVMFMYSSVDCDCHVKVAPCDALCACTGEVCVPVCIKRKRQAVAEGREAS